MSNVPGIASGLSSQFIVRLGLVHKSPPVEGRQS